MALDVDALREHLNMTADDPDAIDLAVLPRVLDAAKAHTARQLGFALDDIVEYPDGTPADLEQAVLMLAAHWYENREASIAGVAMMPVPIGYDDIIRDHRSYTYG